MYRQVRKKPSSMRGRLFVMQVGLLVRAHLFYPHYFWYSHEHEYYVIDTGIIHNSRPCLELVFSFNFATAFSEYVVFFART
jgi:hypothetical protein